jgi:hypothetical protein
MILRIVCLIKDISFYFVCVIQEICLRLKDSILFKQWGLTIGVQ